MEALTHLIPKLVKTKQKQTTTKTLILEQHTPHMTVHIEKNQSIPLY